eukprot:16144642-Heterocapsa_arctica.AAC.1
MAAMILGYACAAFVQARNVSGHAFGRSHSRGGRAYRGCGRCAQADRVRNGRRTVSIRSDPIS